jgi:capsular polysaccharide transport system permease protein
MFPLSGAAFMVDWLPAAAQQFVLWLPMVHGVEMVRHGFYGHVVQTHFDIGYFAGANLVLSLMGLLVLRLAGRRVKSHP